MELTGNIEAFEMQCYRRVHRIPYTEHIIIKRGSAGPYGTAEETTWQNQSTQDEIFWTRNATQQSRKGCYARTHAWTQKAGGQRRQCLDNL